MHEDGRWRSARVERSLELRTARPPTRVVIDFSAFLATEFFEVGVNIFFGRGIQRLRDMKDAAQKHFFAAPDDRAITASAISALQKRYQIGERRHIFEEGGVKLLAVLEKINIEMVFEVFFLEKLIKKQFGF